VALRRIAELFVPDEHSTIRNGRQKSIIPAPRGDHATPAQRQARERAALAQSPAQGCKRRGGSRTSACTEPITLRGWMFLAAIASHSLLSKLSHLWAYVTLGATSIFTEEAAPVVAGFAAHQGHLHPGRAALACAVGSWVADVVLYGLGRWRAVRVARRWPKVMVHMERLLGAVRRHPWRASLAVRFAYGARLLLPITCGAARIPLGRYAVASATSAWVWSSLFTAVGWVFGQTAVVMIHHVRRHEDKIAVALIALVAIVVLIVTIRNEARVPDEIEGSEHAPQ
jgi:membrane protein DedA with SNARE-associated domain